MMTQEVRKGIRAATYSAENADIVSLLGERPAFDRSLQLIGDALLIPLSDGSGPTERVKGLAQQCSDALRERNWAGDAELADQLDRTIGIGVTSMLRALPVNLEDVSMILEGDPLHGGGYIDLHTGQVLPQSVIDDGGLDGDEDEDYDDDDKWLFVDCTGSRDGYRDMEQFIQTVTDEQRADRLAIAIEGRGAFRRFRSVIDRWEDELDRWYAFSEDRSRGRARRFLADAGYRPAVPTRH